MSKERWFSGFEDGNSFDTSGNDRTIIADALYPARSGDFFLTHYSPSSSILNTTRPLVNGYTCATNGSQVLARMQYAFRIRQLPDAQANLGGFSTGSTVAPAQDARVYLSTTGRVGVEASASNAAVAAAFLSNPITLGVWYVLRLQFTYQRNDAGNDPISATVWVYEGATMDSDSPALLGSAVSAASIAIGNFSMNGAPTLGSNGPQVGIYDFDDWWLSVADGADVTSPDLNWPTGSRIQAVPITSQVIGQWAGAYQLVQDIPNSAISGNEQTTSTPGATTTFQHPTAASLGLIPPSQLADGTDTEQEEAPPFGGWPFSGDTLSGQALTWFLNRRNNTLPVPFINSVVQVAGAGQFSGGVWVRAFTIRQVNSGGTHSYEVGPFSTAQYLSSSSYPNFAAQLDVSFGAGTPDDAFTGADSWDRYGIGLVISNAYNDRGLVAPITDVSGGQPSSATNTTNLRNLGGQQVATPFGQFVALTIGGIFSTNVGPPYPITNPLTRPSTARFLFDSPAQSSVGSGFGGVGPAQPVQFNTVGYVFTPPAALGSSVKPIAEAIKVIPALQRASGSGNDNILIGGAATSVPTTTGFGGSTRNQFAIDWTPRTSAQFDALTFGAQGGAGLGVQLRLGSIIAEVITSGPCTPRTSGDGQYQQQAGIYVANSGSFQKIPLPFRASAILVKKIGTTASAGAFKGWWMGGTTSWPINAAAAESIGIMSILDDGFLVGPSNTVNGGTTTYAYLAIKDGQQDTVNDAYMVTGSFQRQGTGDADKTVELALPTLFAATWTPEVVQTFPITVVKTPDMVAPNSLEFGSTGLITNGIVALGDKTFTTGTLYPAGQYPYWAFKFDAAGLLATLFQVGAFAGNNATQVIPTNFRGELIVLDHPQAGYTGRFRSDQGNTGNNSVPWPGGNVTTIDITAIAALSFTVGTGASVTGQTSYWLAWKKDGSIGNTGNTNLPIPPDINPIPDPINTICGGGGLKLAPGSANGQACRQC